MRITSVAKRKHGQLPRRRFVGGRTTSAGLLLTAAVVLTSTLTASPAGAATVTTCTLTPGTVLHTDEQVSDCGGAGYDLVLQGDGNLVLYKASTNEALWSTSTQGQGVDQAVMQTDGNFVLYAGDRAVWSTGTDGFDGASLAVQNDANLVVYEAGHAVWTRHAGFTNELQVFVPDPRAAEYRVLSAERPDESTSDAQDETTDLVPFGARAGDIIRLQGPTGQIKYYSVLADPSFGKILNSAVGGAITGATGAAVMVPMNEATGQKNTVGLILTTAVGGAAGAAVGLVGGVWSAVTDPTLTVVPGLSYGVSGKLIPATGYYVKGYGILPLQPTK